MIGPGIVLMGLMPLVVSQESFCPQFMQEQTACTCFSYVDGAVIKCSGPNGPGVVEKLKSIRNEIRELTIQNANIIEIGPRAFRNIRVKTLILDHNRIRAIHPDAFRGLEDILLSLSISHNKLTEVPTDSLIGLRHLRVLNLKCNNIGDIYGSVFRNVSQLIELNLGCNQICKISGPAFQSIKDSLQSLILDNNCLQEIPAEALRNFKTLLALHLQYNQIETIEKLQLMNLVSLLMVRLTGNKIRSVDRYGLTNVPKLRYLFLDQNELTSIQPNVLQQFKYLEIIDLSYNNIAEIPGDTFKGLEHLMQLNLEGNTIKDIAPGAFAETPLLLLLLSHNCLTSVNQQMFQGVPFLRQLTLSNNNIRLIQPLSFSHLGDMHLLDLSHNKIQVIQPGALMASTHVTVVLRENPLVCTQQGFHILQGGQLIHLLNEPNVVCKTDYSEKHNDTCPTRKTNPVTEPCCKPYRAVEEETTTTTPISNRRFFRTTEPSNFGVRDIRTTASTPQPSTEQAARQSQGGPRRINMERFWRLSQQTTRIQHPSANTKPGSHRERFLVPLLTTTVIPATETEESDYESRTTTQKVSTVTSAKDRLDLIRPKLGHPPARPQFPPRLVPATFPLPPVGPFQENSGLLIGQPPHLPEDVGAGAGQLPPWVIHSSSKSKGDKKGDKSSVAVSFQEDAQRKLRIDNSREETVLAQSEIQLVDSINRRKR